MCTKQTALSGTTRSGWDKCEATRKILAVIGECLQIVLKFEHLGSAGIPACGFWEHPAPSSGTQSGGCFVNPQAEMPALLKGVTSNHAEGSPEEKLFPSGPFVERVN